MGRSISVSPHCYHVSDHIFSFPKGQFKCYSLSGCDDAIQGGSTAEECCLGDGQTYRMNGGSACNQCIGKWRGMSTVEVGVGAYILQQ